MRIMRSNMLLNLLRLRSCSWLILMKRREGNITFGGFFLAKSQINKGMIVALANIKSPAFKKES